MQEATQAPIAAPGAAGSSNAEAMNAMGFDHLIHNFDPLGWIVFVTLVIMSLMSWFYIVYNFLRNVRLKSRTERVISTFWETPSLQDAIRSLEGESKGEPFSKIALDSASAAAHHQRDELSRVKACDWKPASPCSPRSVRRHRSLVCSARSGASTTL